MPKLVKQTITLPAPAKDLYAMYLNPRMHKAITGGKVVISARPGSKFSAFGGMLRGRTLYTVPGRLIVQAWRSSGWKKGDLDSTLILRFTPKGVAAASISSTPTFPTTTTAASTTAGRSTTGGRGGNT